MQLCCLPSLYSSVSAKSSLGRGMCLRTNREAWWLVYCRMQLYHMDILVFVSNCIRHTMCWGMLDYSPTY